MNFGVKSLIIPQEKCLDIGLKSIELSRLGRVVALAGKNGAGKTRILNFLEETLVKRRNYLSRPTEYDGEIKHFEDLISSYKDSPDIKGWKAQLAEREDLRRSLSIVSVEDSVRAFLKFVPKNLNLSDHREMSFSGWADRHRTAGSVGANNHDHCFAYIQFLQNSWREATHGGKQEERSETISYSALDDLLFLMLGVRLGRDATGLATIFGKVLSSAKLSDGQKVILQMCVALHAIGADIDNTVFIMDEPENHLHPSAALELFQAIYKSSETSQLWVATHSIPLLAHFFSFDPMSVWYVNDGTAKNSGRNPTAVLESLLGGEEEQEKLHKFTGLPVVLASLNYAVECLLPPKVLPGTGDVDKQANQVCSVIQKVLPFDRKITVLEVGAGQGRLLDSIAVQSELQGKDVSDRFEYLAYEPFVDVGPCRRIIEKYYGNGRERLFRSEQEIFISEDERSVDIVVMCNVLHEISPLSWPTLFGPGSLIYRVLKDDGFLLIVEDQRLPNGESAHEYGFVLLDTPEIKSLFSITEADKKASLFEFDSRSDGRLKAHLIGKSILQRVTAASRKKAIEELQRSAKSNITRIRDGDKTYKGGVEHAFWVQQYTNASLFLDGF